MATSKYYVVWKGKKPGIYTSWAECQLQITGFNQAAYKSFPTFAEAEYAFKNGNTISRKPTSPIQTITTSYPKEKAICVDAACSGNPGKMEYRGVLLHTKEQVFISKVYPKGTNNIGEFLAIVHALAWMEQNNTWMPIYSDSVNAISWISKNSCRTKLIEDPSTEDLYAVIERAEHWLRLHTERRNWIIRKWETKQWGEIPADFGRK